MNATTRSKPVDAVIETTGAVQATNGTVKKPRKARVPLEGFEVRFRIKDQAEYDQLTALADADNRSPDNFAHLLVRRAIKSAATSTT